MSAPISSRSQFVICLAGHIDHGKSSIVRALTGATTDRLPEEKRRGITIELGFSHFDADGRRFALIDVPGHERFIHNMVAGASGVDAALLVVAADDSVMPQTREHLALLELLGIRRGVIAISKCDLADDEQLEMVDLEVDELVSSTFLADAPRLRVSTQTGEGIAELKTALMEAALQSPARAAGDRRFRLPIDRAFSLTGQGAVVTGTVWRGTARVGDKLQILPAATLVRIRQLQSQGSDVDQVSAGERAAMNLVGVKASEIRRGDELATPDAFSPATRHLVQLRALPDVRAALRHRQFVRVHLGANQVTAQVLMDQREVPPGKSAFAVLRCRQPIVAEYGQPFVIRQLSPATTIGGGTIISPGLQPVDRQARCLELAPALGGADAVERVYAYIALRREARFDETSESWLGLDEEACRKALLQLLRQRRIVRVPATPPIHVVAERFEKLQQQFVRGCKAELARRRPASQIPISAVFSAMSKAACADVLTATLESLIARKEVVRRGDKMGLSSGADLSNRQRQILDAFVAAVTRSAATPPTLREFSEQHRIELADLEPLVQVAVDEGTLVRLAPQLAIVPEALETLRRSLSDYFQKHPSAKVSEVREHWGMTRRHAVPIFEYFDEQGITRRDGDLRTPGPRIAMTLEATR
ncbi:MAG: selenocysteine-specific translation elongation factor [Planctomycetaceae bacterium]|nr:selenocysteine-specific translation elongation factor [Planctomycetaceae bacterium]